MAEQRKPFRGPRLKTLENIRAFVSKTLRQVQRGEIDVEEARLNLSGARVLTEIIVQQSADRERADIAALKAMALKMSEQVAMLRERDRDVIELPAHREDRDGGTGS